MAMSEPWQFGKFFFAPAHMHGAVFRAAAQGGNGFSGIQQPLRIKCRLYSMEHLQFARPELGAHLIDFFHANPVLAGNGPPGLHAHVKYFFSEFLSQFELARLARIIEYQRMQISIAGVKDIHAAQAVFLGKGFDPAQYL